MLTRQKALLYFLHAAGGQASRLQLAKWCFLLARETESGGGPSFYRFVPNRHGPFSFCLIREACALEGAGFLASADDVSWALTRTGRDAAGLLPPSVRNDVEWIVAAYGGMSAADLADDMQDRYRWFAIDSDVGDAWIRPVAEPMVYTAGYQGTLVDGFLDGLLRNGIEQIIDVRRNPISRVYGFHKATLARLCGYLGIEYCHFPELGIAGRERQSLATDADYERLFRVYRANVLVHHRDTVQRVGDLMQRRPAALLCFENRPDHCHRSHLAAAVSDSNGGPVRHLELAE